MWSVVFSSPSLSPYMLCTSLLTSLRPSLPPSLFYPAIPYGGFSIECFPQYLVETSEGERVVHLCLQPPTTQNWENKGHLSTVHMYVYTYTYVHVQCSKVTSFPGFTLVYLLLELGNKAITYNVRLDWSKAKGRQAVKVLSQKEKKAELLEWDSSLRSPDYQAGALLRAAQ